MATPRSPGRVGRPAGFSIYPNRLGAGSGFTSRGKAIRGYDPVAYFTEGKPSEGMLRFTHRWLDALWYFASDENRALFIEEPERYAPQYGGYCAWAVSRGYTASTDPEAWMIVDEKLYLNYSKSVQAEWERISPATSPRPTRTGRSYSLKASTHYQN